MSAQGLILSIMKQDSFMHLLRFYCFFVQDYYMNHTFIYSYIISQSETTVFIPWMMDLYQILNYK
jgi:hypothetical protein